MRILKSILLVSSCLLFGVYNVSADELTDCLTSESSTCELSSDITIADSITVVGSKTLILNDSKITSTISGPLFNVGSGASLSVNAGLGSVENSGIVFNVNGGLLTINGGSYLSTSKAALLETAGSVVFNRGGMFGMTGIEVQGGSLVSAGNMTSNYRGLNLGKNAASVENVLTGTGLAIVKGKTSTPITVSINGGNLLGMYAFYEADLGTGSNTAIVNINNGDFLTSGNYSIKAESLTKFIQGGTFVDRPDDFDTYMADGKELEGDAVLNKKYDINVRNSVNGSIVTDVVKARLGDRVSISVTSDEGYSLSGLKVYKVSDDSEVVVSNKSFVMPNEEVYVVATFKKDAVVAPSKEIIVNTTEPDIDNTFGVLSNITTESAYKNALAEIIKNDASVSKVELTLNTDDVSDTMNTTHPGGINKITSYVKRISDTAVIIKYYEVSLDISIEDLKSKVLNKNLVTNYKIIIPEEYQKENRKYFVIGYDGNNAYTVKDATLDKNGEYMLFTSNKYDVFALMYTDGNYTEVDDSLDNNKPGSPSGSGQGTVLNPNTYDDVYKYFYINGLSVLGLLSIVITYKKKCR